jgi:hypothetical protein
MEIIAAPVPALKNLARMLISVENEREYTEE